MHGRLLAHRAPLLRDGEVGAAQLFLGSGSQTQPQLVGACWELAHRQFPEVLKPTVLAGRWQLDGYRRDGFSAVQDLERRGRVAARPAVEGEIEDHLRV